MSTTTLVTIVTVAVLLAAADVINAGSLSICGKACRETGEVCGRDGKDYDSKCHAACAGTSIACKGSCPCSDHPVCECEPSDKEVCGTDGATYDSECHATCNGVDKECDGACPCGGSCQCTEEISYVCGADGVTYDNSCLAECSEVSIACNGECPCEPTTKCENGNDFEECNVSAVCAEAKDCAAWPEAVCSGADPCNKCSPQYTVEGEAVNCGITLCKPKGSLCFDKSPAKCCGTCCQCGEKFKKVFKKFNKAGVCVAGDKCPDDPKDC
ncbi:hypothetical protein BSKO_11462 [Bryopsis sp. KO-2023]|nr:hypothetical protein BSKO_11462 [Bryopsis sp. KO-2023]